MELGSHNTMSYLKPLKWWMWVGRFMAKCQKISYSEQYEAGVRYFDLRISFPKHKDGVYGTPVFSHGLMDFKGVTPSEVLEFLNSKDDVYCRIILEKGDETAEELFRIYINKWLKKYPNLKIWLMVEKSQWKTLVEPNVTLHTDMLDKYASNNGTYPQYEKWPSIFKSKTWSGLLIDDLWPWIYAKIHNKKILKQFADKDVILLMDFISKQK